MCSYPFRRARVALVLALAVSCLLPGPAAVVLAQPPSTTVAELAKRVDRVQEQFDHYGTVVAKTPDVYGESRLLNHRTDFEAQMKEELTKFNFRLNASESFRDSSLLATALAIEAGLGGQVTERTDASGQPIVITQNATTPPSLDRIFIEQDDGSLIARRGFTEKAGDQIPKVDIEPTIQLDQKARYLRHLNQLRRLNEGDDTADSPGYSLYMVRLPVSVLPGKQTREGYGADVSVTLDPYLSEELLPMAWRDLVTNDVVDLLAYPLYKVTRSIDIDEVRASYSKLFESAPTEDDETVNDLRSSNRRRPYLETYVVENFEEGGKPGTQSRVKGIRTKPTSTVFHGSTAKGPVPASHFSEYVGSGFPVFILAAYDNLVGLEDVPPPFQRGLHYQDVSTFLRREVVAAYDLLEQPAAAPLWTYCNQQTVAAIREYRGNVSEKRLEWLQDAEYPGGPVTYNRLQERKKAAITMSTIRRNFFNLFDELFPEANPSATSSLCWQIIAASALLNDRLLDDMRELAASRKCDCLPGAGMPPKSLWIEYFQPNPSPEARASFNEYIRCRFPVHVFALDPVTETQNISSSTQQRRELQIAMAAAARQGPFSFNNINQLARRLEYDLDTIELNRTSYGYVHGSDTFGWRFEPRVQAPPPPGLIGVARQSFTGGLSREQRRARRWIEPGIRECTALVVMPSFVPYLSVDVKTSWYPLGCDLDNHARKLAIGPKIAAAPKAALAFLKPKAGRLSHGRTLDLSDAMSLSREIRSLEYLSSQCLRDAGHYRADDINSLTQAISRLERQLPMQSHLIPVPFENRMGGFEMFNAGVTDLAPELFGYYGAPYVLVAGDKAPAMGEEEPADQDGTDLYLIGRSFSVIGTRVIAGGIDVTDTMEMVSRELIRVHIPTSARSSENIDGRRVVDVHVITPYGVTDNLDIPAQAIDEEKAEEAPAPTPDFAVSEPPALTAYVEYNIAGGLNKIVPLNLPTDALKIQSNRSRDAFGDNAPDEIAFFVDVATGEAIATPVAIPPVAIPAIVPGETVETVAIAPLVQAAFNVLEPTWPTAANRPTAIRLRPFVRSAKAGGAGTAVDGGLVVALRSRQLENCVVPTPTPFSQSGGTAGCPAPVLLGPPTEVTTGDGTALDPSMDAPPIPYRPADANQTPLRPTRASRASGDQSPNGLADLLGPEEPDTTDESDTTENSKAADELDAPATGEPIGTGPNPAVLYLLPTLR